jgi:hypothetical protein
VDNRDDDEGTTDEALNTTIIMVTNKRTTFNVTEDIFVEMIKNGLESVSDIVINIISRALLVLAGGLGLIALFLLLGKKALIFLLSMGSLQLPDFPNIEDFNPTLSPQKDILTTTLVGWRFDLILQNLFCQPCVGLRTVIPF